MSTSTRRPEAPSSSKPQTFYALVLHDFTAERADELDAKAGDAITVVAQSNREWLVAKPIGKLGRPGLIPVAFVEIRDPQTGQPLQDVGTLIEGGALPPVEEWKRQVMSYKANSISLGVLDETFSAQIASASSKKLSSPSTDPHNASPYITQQQPPDEPPPPTLLPEGILISADVKSFHFEMDEYWFRVHAIFQPYSDGPLPQAQELVLFRSYNDFYDFQVSLLDAFPREAGRQDPGRVLPFMPGPVPHVDNEITVNRHQELDEYLHELCRLPEKGGRAVIESDLVREFFALKPGDAGADTEPQVRAIESLSYSESQSTFYGIEKPLSRMRLSGGPDSGYEESDNMAPRRSAYGHDTRASLDFRHGRTESSASMYKSFPSGLASHPASQSRSTSRTNSLAGRTDSYEPARNGSALEIDPYRANGYSRSSLVSSQDPSPIRSSHAPSISTSASGQSRAQSMANNPPISSSIPQTAFIKIKIFDKVSDDVVAIRVHPRVTHAQLLDKVRARLGENVVALRYRDSVNNALIDLADDEDLRFFLDGTDRHVLYADSE